MRIPVASYRLQFNRDFRYKDAQAIVPYLHRLGISHLYASPTFQARRGSEHGYDVADPTRINAEVGTRQEFDSLIRELHKHGMELLLDIVPNHMAASIENPWWKDVLENGRHSPYGHFFDIDWDSGRHPGEHHARVVLPVLGDAYRRVLEKGELRLGYDAQGFFIDYHSLRLPLAPETYPEILQDCAAQLPRNPQARALNSKLRRFEREFSPASPSPARFDKIAALKTQIWNLHQSSKKFRAALTHVLHQFDPGSGDPHARRLDALLAQQHYRLAYWRAAQDFLNYRRFFDINDLVALRVEQPDVFRARHAAIAELIREGAIGALRVDHVDGLRDPLEYLRRARRELRSPDSNGNENSARASASDSASDSGVVYTIVEKIICGDETLPHEWPIEGTTGYDFINAANFLFTSGPGYAQLEKLHSKLTGDPPSFELVWESKKQKAIDLLFRAEARALAGRLAQLAALDPRARQLSRSDLLRALSEFTSCLPIYRTYIRSHAISELERETLSRTLRLAAQRRGSILARPPLKSFFSRVFTPPASNTAGASLASPSSSARHQWRCDWLEFLLRWQVFTGPVMAKGFEDTAFYTYIPLISLNEVGSNPGRAPRLFGAAPFHRFIQNRASRWPHSMNASSTHDTKRSEDVRARIDVLSEIPGEWSAALSRWRRLNQRHLLADENNASQITPSPREESLIYQSLAGAWPLSLSGLPDLTERMRNFLVKAAREAKDCSGWLDPNEQHEQRLQKFLTNILNPRVSQVFIRDFDKFHQRIASAGAINSLAQLLLKIAAPGLPDFYQGNDLWEFSLTDPDNRRPVDFHKRIQLLEKMEAALAQNREKLCATLTVNWKDSRIKLFLTAVVLRFRKRLPELFARGSYIPIQAIGPAAEHILCFARVYRGEWVLLAVPRLVQKFADAKTCSLNLEAFEATRLPLPPHSPSRWTNVFTAEQFSVALFSLPASGSRAAVASTATRAQFLPAAVLFRHLPFALLTASC